jgi:hypothetical protein
MTLPVSSSAPAPLDLATISTVQSVVVRALRDKVITWEQDAIDRANRGEYSAAQQSKAWAFAAEICASTVSTACTALFLDACAYQPSIPDQRRVELPRINRSARDVALDVMALEVASEQPEPCGHS